MRFEKIPYKRNRKFISILIIFFVIFSVFIREDNLGWCIDQQDTHVIKRDALALVDCHSKLTLSNVLYKSIPAHQDLSEIDTEKNCLDISIASYKSGLFLQSEPTIEKHSQTASFTYLSNPSWSPINIISNSQFFQYNNSSSISSTLRVLRTIVLLI